MATNPPALVMIIRHGEKPGDPSNDNDGGPFLSTLGSARAAALPSLFTPDPTATPANMQQLSCDLAVGTELAFTGTYVSSRISAGQSRFKTPDFLFATQPDSSSARPLDTITPLAQALQAFSNPFITINSNYTNDPNDQKQGIPALVAEINGNPNTYGGKVILIAWHHGQIPTMTEDFGVPSSQLASWSPWPPTVFDLVFKITWTAGQANLEVDYQQLLFGDTPAKSS